MFFVLWISEISPPLFITARNIWWYNVTSSSQHLITGTCVALGQVWQYWYNNICELKGFLYSLASEEEDFVVTLVQYISLDMYIKFHNNLLNNIYPLYQLINYEILSYIEHNKHYNSNNCTIEKTFKIID